jgi:hypothetical protein
MRQEAFRTGQMYRPRLRVSEMPSFSSQSTMELPDPLSARSGRLLSLRTVIAFEEEANDRADPQDR